MCGTSYKATMARGRGAGDRRGRQVHTCIYRWAGCPDSITPKSEFEIQIVYIVIHEVDVACSGEQKVTPN